MQRKGLSSITTVVKIRNGVDVWLNVEDSWKTRKENLMERVRDESRGKMLA